MVCQRCFMVFQGVSMFQVSLLLSTWWILMVLCKLVAACYERTNFRILRLESWFLRPRPSISKSSNRNPKEPQSLCCSQFLRQLELQLTHMAKFLCLKMESCWKQRTQSNHPSVLDLWCLLFKLLRGLRFHKVYLDIRGYLHPKTIGMKLSHCHLINKRSLDFSKKTDERFKLKPFKQFSNFWCPFHHVTSAYIREHLGFQGCLLWKLGFKGCEASSLHLRNSKWMSPDLGYVG